MKREQIIKQLYGDVTPWEEQHFITIMSTEMDSFVEELVKESGSHKHEGGYYFLGRLGKNYREYPFNWEPFRDFAGPLLRGTESIPIVVISNETEPEKPQVVKASLPKPHYQIIISPKCSTVDIINTWWELLFDNDAIPHTGGEQKHQWFFENLNVSVEQLSEKARKFVNKFD